MVENIVAVVVDCDYFVVVAAEFDLDFNTGTKSAFKTLMYL